MRWLISQTNDKRQVQFKKSSIESKRTANWELHKLFFKSFQAKKNYVLKAFFQRQKSNFKIWKLKTKNACDTNAINDFNLYTIYVCAIKQFLHWNENWMHCQWKKNWVVWAEKMRMLCLPNDKYSFVVMHSIGIHRAKAVIVVFCISITISVFCVVACQQNISNAFVCAIATWAGSVFLEHVVWYYKNVHISHIKCNFARKNPQ